MIRLPGDFFLGRRRVFLGRCCSPLGDVDISQGQNQTKPTSPKETKVRPSFYISQGPPPNYTNISQVSKTKPSQRLPSIITIPSQRLPSIKSNHLYISQVLKTKPSQRLPSIKNQTISTSPKYQIKPSLHLPSIKNQTISTSPKYDNHTIFTYQKRNKQTNK